MTRRPGLIDSTVEALRVRIVSGQWEVGSRIPTEPALVALLGVGRNTVREAVQALVHSGLVERRQGSGTYVVGRSELAVSMGREVADAAQSDVVEVRRALEVEAARLAASRRTVEEAAEMQRVLEQRRAAFEQHDIEAQVSTDLLLHRVIVRSSGNPLLGELYDDLIDAIGENIRINLVTEQPCHGKSSHDGLVQAILDRDPAAAGREAGEYLTALLED